MIKKILFLILFIAYYAFNAHSDQSSSRRLVDKSCVIIGEQPILLSEVKRKAQESSLSMADAQEELLDERKLRIIAQTMPKINSADIPREALEHAKKIMAANKLSQEQMEPVLIKSYGLTFKQWLYEIQTALYKNRLDSIIASTIQISDHEAQEEYAKRQRNKQQFFDIVFISILPKTGTSLNAQFSRANSIKKEILTPKSLDEIKIKYNYPDISFVGPLDYQEGVLKEKYDSKLKKIPASKVTDPFEEDGVVTMIWKVEKAALSDNKTTALENVKKDLYTEAVRRGRRAYVNNFQARSPVEIKCKW